MLKEDLRVIKTLESIDEALIENLRIKPFDKITVDALCRTARINRTTFYKHYKDKFELFNKYVDRIIEEFRVNNEALFIEANPESVDNSVYKLSFRKSLDFLIEKKEIYEVLWSCSSERDIFNEMICAAVDNIIEKEVSKNPDILSDNRKYFIISLFAKLFSVNYLESVRWWFVNGKTEDKEEFSELFDQMIKDGLFKTFKAKI